MQHFDGDLLEEAMGLKICQGAGCRHYYEVSKYPRACYYEPQCWRGYVNIWVLVAFQRLVARSSNFISPPAGSSLFHGNTLGKIAGKIDRAIALPRRIIGQKLHRHRINKR